MGFTVLKRDRATSGLSNQLYYYKQVAAGQKTDIVYIDNPLATAISLSPGAGVTSAYWQCTITPREIIETLGESAINWHMWPIGSVAAAAGNKIDGLLAEVTAVRGTSIGGATVFEIRSRVEDKQ